MKKEESTILNATERKATILALAGMYSGLFEFSRANFKHIGNSSIYNIESLDGEVDISLYFYSKNEQNDEYTHQLDELISYIIDNKYPDCFKEGYRDTMSEQDGLAYLYNLFNIGIARIHNSNINDVDEDLNITRRDTIKAKKFLLNHGINANFLTEEAQALYLSSQLLEDFLEEKEYIIDLKRKYIDYLKNFVGEKIESKVSDEKWKKENYLQYKDYECEKLRARLITLAIASRKVDAELLNEPNFDNHLSLMYAPRDMLVPDIRTAIFHPGKDRMKETEKLRGDLYSSMYPYDFPFKALKNNEFACRMKEKSILKDIFKDYNHNRLRNFAYRLMKSNTFRDSNAGDSRTLITAVMLNLALLDGVKIKNNIVDGAIDSIQSYKMKDKLSLILNYFDIMYDQAQKNPRIVNSIVNKLNYMEQLKEKEK